MSKTFRMFLATLVVSTGAAFTMGTTSASADMFPVGGYWGGGHYWNGGHYWGGWAPRYTHYWGGYGGYEGGCYYKTIVTYDGTEIVKKFCY